MIKTCYICEECGKVYDKHEDAQNCEKKHKVDEMISKAKEKQMDDLASVMAKIYKEHYDIKDNKREVNLQNFFNDLWIKIEEKFYANEIFNDHVYCGFSANFVEKKDLPQEQQKIEKNKNKDDFFNFLFDILDV